MVTVDEGNVIVQAESVEPLHLKMEDNNKYRNGKRRQGQFNGYN